MAWRKELGTKYMYPFSLKSNRPHILVVPYINLLSFGMEVQYPECEVKPNPANFKPSTEPGLEIFDPTFIIIFFPSPQLNQLEKAVEAGHTFFMANPEHMEMQQNIENYRTMAGVKEAQLVDREAKPHMVSSGDPSQPCGAKSS